ncbi:MAG TPA: DUF883 domain-containing protein [Verrucomicrobia bacterium]|nr:MAG: hypothetical protein A2X46_03270 [Lentisphaerae bacterium GWF2_57_35]HBA84231.1 DUF883 domain-containing protein [Verrucomicrobiota bacterium]
METTTPSDEKINEALELLNQAVKEKKTEIRNLVSEKYGELSTMFSSVGEEVSGHMQGASEALRDIQNRSKERAKELAEEMDHRVHESPWTSLGFAALGALVIGYVLGRKE